MKDHNDPDVGYFAPNACDPNVFLTLIEQTLDPATAGYACDIQKNIPIYHMQSLGALLEDNATRREIMTEWAHGLMYGSGAFVLRAAYTDTRVLDEGTSIYRTIIAAEKLVQDSGGDHFAAPGANDRIWNSLQKLCEKAPDVFLRYFANIPIATACEAWLGPNYQMTAQINLVHPGGTAQQAHRDYHLGFQTAKVSADYPIHVHNLSPALTLQGAIAHCDMPIESGPTKLLPFSQLYRAGYVAWRRPDFRMLFEKHCIQLPLMKGDALFFNPAVLHAAGANTSRDIHRMVNLLQVSSAFGRAMETVNRHKMCQCLYPFAAASYGDQSLSLAELSASIAAAAEGYSFPTNLDCDPPKAGLAPETQQALFMRAISNGMSEQDFASQLDQMLVNQSA